MDMFKYSMVLYAGWAQTLLASQANMAMLWCSASPSAPAPSSQDNVPAGEMPAHAALVGQCCKVGRVYVMSAGIGLSSVPATKMHQSAALRKESRVCVPVLALVCLGVSSRGQHAVDPVPHHKAVWQAGDLTVHLPCCWPHSQAATSLVLA